ncbi:hypothetical protein WN982_40695 [Paraburkholderia sp. IMGN_8]|uniref:hypothetical protein n=1 Tax=Paraburkholderia sp. IMGN_8 TaxID=3136564 RepID=UPI003100F76B
MKKLCTFALTAATLALTTTHAFATAYEKQASDYGYKRVTLDKCEVKEGTSINGSKYKEIYVTYTDTASGKVGVAPCIDGKICESLQVKPETFTKLQGKRAMLKMDSRIADFKTQSSEDIIMGIKVLK